MQLINRKARFNHHIIESFEAGIVLSGAEVKSIRGGKVDLGDSFARIINGELILKNAYIYPYLGQSAANVDVRRDRKLLVHKSQISELVGKLSKGGMALIPLRLYTKHNFIKVELGLAQSKKKFDKRRAIKARDEERRIQQELKGRSF